MTTVLTRPNGVPGPRATPLLGSRTNFLRFLQRPLDFLEQLHRAYGPIAGIVENHPTMIFVFSPEYHRVVLSDQDLFYNLSLTDGFFPIPPNAAIRYLNTNLFTMNGDLHKRMRHLAMPAFHKKYIEHHRDEIVRIADSIMHGWPDKGQIDVYEQMSRLTLQVAMQVFLGVDTQRDLSDLDHRLAHSLNDLFKKSVIIFPVNVPGTPYRRMLDNAEQLATQLRQLIAQKRAGLHEQRDVLAMLMEARDENGVPLTENELIGQAHILISAGHESSSSALTWTLFLLSQHPHILANVLDELESVLHGAAPTIEQLGQLKLLDYVIKESLRVLSPSSVGSRISSDVCEIGPYQFGKGAVITVCPHIIHHSPLIYTEPYKFMPLRWEKIDPSPYEYLPFSAGPRRCIGSTFAIMEFKIVLAMMLQRYRLTVVPGEKVDPVAKPILSPKNGLRMIVARQDRQFRKTEVRGTVHTMVDLS